VELVGIVGRRAASVYGSLVETLGTKQLTSDVQFHVRHFQCPITSSDVLFVWLRSTQSVGLFVQSAGEIRLLMSDHLISRAKTAMHGQVLSISDIIQVLRLQLTVAECDIFAFPSIESDVVVLVMPVTASPTPLQVGYGAQTCALFLFCCHDLSPDLD